jgi:hypothetical protein
LLGLAEYCGVAVPIVLSGQSPGAGGPVVYQLAALVVAAV